jgi:chromosomal replication initiation ATPase DnaA
VNAPAEQPIILLEKPEPVQTKCAICYQPLRANFYWMVNRWIRTTVHDKCAEAFDASRSGTIRGEENATNVPERFTVFNHGQFWDKHALFEVKDFLPDSRLKTLALIGDSGLGKSRLMWAVIQQFFDQLRLENGYQSKIQYFIFADVLSEFDRNKLLAIKGAKYAFIDDIGAVDSHGQPRAQLQQVIRARIQTGMWTFLTVDNEDFDPGMRDVFRGRAKVIFIRGQ